MSLGQKVNQSFVKKEILSGCHPSKNHEQISFGLGKKEEGKKRNQNPQNPYIHIFFVAPFWNPLPNDLLLPEQNCLVVC